MASTNESNDAIIADALNTSTTQSDSASTANQQAGDPSSASDSHQKLPLLKTNIPWLWHIILFCSSILKILCDGAANYMIVYIYYL